MFVLCFLVAALLLLSLGFLITAYRLDVFCQTGPHSQLPRRERVDRSPDPEAVQEIWSSFDRTAASMIESLTMTRWDRSQRRENARRLRAAFEALSALADGMERSLSINPEVSLTHGDELRELIRAARERYRRQQEPPLECRLSSAILSQLKDSCWSPRRWVE